jgi:hypothetical protein
MAAIYAAIMHPTYTFTEKGKPFDFFPRLRDGGSVHKKLYRK